MFCLSLANIICSNFERCLPTFPNSSINDLINNFIHNFLHTFNFSQLLFGFKMTAPLNWVEAPQKTKRLGEYSNYSATSNSPAQERSYTYTTNRSWTLTQKVDQPHPSSTYVFEFSIDVILAHFCV